MENLDDYKCDCDEPKWKFIENVRHDGSLYNCHECEVCEKQANIEVDEEPEFDKELWQFSRGVL